MQRCFYAFSSYDEHQKGLGENVVFVSMISGTQCSWNLGRGSEAEIIVELVFQSE